MEKYFVLPHGEGKSHGPAIGCVIDGCPPNILLSERDIQSDMDRRRPGQSKFTTQRKKVTKFIYCLEYLMEGQLVHQFQL